MLRQRWGIFYANVKVISNIVVSYVIGVCTICLPSARAQGPMPYNDLETLLDSDPYLPIPPIQRIFQPELVEVWNDALLAPEADLRRRTAETITYAHSLGMKGLEVTSANLEQLAGDRQQPLLVRIAAARALVALDCKESADATWSVFQDAGPDRASVLARGLARWRDERARQFWLATLRDGRDSPRHVIVAAEGLGQMEDKDAQPYLLQRVQDVKTPPAVRLAAARALACIEDDGWLELAQKLVSQPGSTHFDRLLAAELLARHSGPATIELLASLAVDQEPVVANAALRRLSELDLDRVASRAPTLLACRDSGVRRWAVQAVGKFPSDANIVLLARVLYDPHPQLRVLAREELLAFAIQSGLREPVIQAAMQALESSDWRAVEQACRLVGHLDHKPAAPRLVAVLEMPRFEASVTAAWALRKLAVAELLPEVLAFATRTTELARSGKLSWQHDPLLSHLFQLFGVLHYRQAEPLLQQYLPKNMHRLPPESRAAAVWTLGHFYAGQPDNPYVDVLVERLADVYSQPPEHERVRQMCAVSLGRMKAAAALPTLRRFYQTEGSNMPAGLACGWAIQQITGEPYQPPKQILLYRQGWFLSPWK